MKILMINQFAFSPTQAGGTRHFNYAKGLIKLGHDVTILCAGFDHFTRKKVAQGDSVHEEVHDGVKFVRLPTHEYGESPWNRLRGLFGFAWQVYRYRPQEKPEIVWGSSPSPFAALGAERLAARFGSSFVLEIRDLWPESLIDLKGLKPWHPFVILVRAVIGFLHRRARLIVTSLSKGDSYFKTKRGLGGPVIVLPHVLDFSLVPAPSAPAETERFSVLYCGMLGENNRVELLIEAVGHLKGKGHGEKLDIRILGDGPRRAALEARALELGLSNISFEGTVSKREIYSRMKSAGAFVIMTPPAGLYRWGFSPNKLLDYMAMARPVLMVTDEADNPVAESAGGVTIPAGSPEALAEGLMAIASTSPSERWQMGRRARQYSESHHDLFRRTNELDLALRRVLRGYDAEGVA